MTIVLVGGVERKKSNRVASCQFAKNIVAPDFSPRIGWNQAAGFDPKYFHTKGPLWLYSTPAVADRIASISAPGSLPSAALALKGLEACKW